MTADRLRPHDGPVLDRSRDDLADLTAEQVEAATRRIVADALAEDLGEIGDLTSVATVPPDVRGEAAFVARAAGVVAGVGVVEEVCAQVDAAIDVAMVVADGDRVVRGDVLGTLSGPLRSVMTAERTALNLLTKLSGVATATARFVDAVEGTGCAVRDTRKTTPGMRVLEKAAVGAGGGRRHRVGLHDSILVKDNHVAAAGGVAEAARAALEHAAGAVHVQVEVTSMTELDEALAVGVVDVLLDNFTPDEVRVAVEHVAGRARLEASGGIDLDTVRSFAEAGVDRVAVGALTHSSPALDIALDVTVVTGG